MQDPSKKKKLPEPVKESWTQMQSIPVADAPTLAWEALYEWTLSTDYISCGQQTLSRMMCKVSYASLRAIFRIFIDLAADFRQVLPEIRRNGPNT